MGRWFTVLGHSALLFGLAVVEPGLSRADGSARGSITTAAFTTEKQAAERNWHAFWNNHLGTWKGSWTRYTPEGGIKESFASTREFTANSATTEIVQNNRYRYADGRSRHKQWSYNVKDHNQRDGFAHPASIPMRGLALDNGAAAWLIPSLEPNQFTPFELFLMDGDRRHSVGVLYGKDGALLRTASIREQRGNASTDGWTDAIDQVNPWHPIGQWQGQGRLILKDLSRLPASPTFWQWMPPGESDQSNHYLPDRIILRCPKRITPMQPFSIQVIWMLRDDAMQTITAEYDKDLELIDVTHQSLSPGTPPN